jgi:hypothetical protein
MSYNERILDYLWSVAPGGTGAPTQFLVFGHDRGVPQRWLERHGSLAGSVQFYFLSDDGQLEVLK